MVVAGILHCQYSVILSVSYVEGNSNFTGLCVCFFQHLGKSRFLVTEEVLEIQPVIEAMCCERELTGCGVEKNTP